MSLDLDKFKSINDSLGHEVGDQVLKVFSARLSGIIRASDTIARVGGDEFVLMMLETKKREDATAIAKKNPGIRYGATFYRRSSALFVYQHRNCHLSRRCGGYGKPAKEI